MLKQIPNPPMTLFYKGDLFSCNLDRTLAFVGSRRASFVGKEAVKSIISDLRGTDLTVVSGLAAGIDTLSHEAAITNNLKTIGVIASGFDFVYPSSSKYLYEKMENASREYTYDRVRRMIGRQKERYGWEFLFIGANIDAVETARRYGIDEDRAVNYNADAKGTGILYESVACAVSSVRKCKALDNGWRDNLDKDYKKRGEM